MSNHINIEKSSAVNTRLPNVYIRKIILGTGKVEIDLSILIEAEKSGEIKFSTVDRLKDTDIKTIISFDAGLTSDIVNKRISLSQDFNFVKNSAERIFTGDNHFFGGTGELFKTTDSQGNMYYELPFSVAFEDKRITSENPKHLSCMAFSYFRDLNEPRGSTKAYASTGKVSADIVYDNTELQTENSVLLSDEKKLWIGDFIKSRTGRLLTGYPRSATGRVLKQEVIPNSKIEDHRVFDKIGALMGQALEASDTLEEKPPVFINKPAEFSNLYLSFDQKKKVRFLFGIDTEQIYLNNAKRPGEIQNQGSLQTLMRKMRIKSLEIRRRNLFDKGQEVLIVESVEEAPGNFIPNKFIKDDKIEDKMDIASIREVFLNRDASSQIRYFGVIDHEASTFTDGQYQYSVLIEYEDGTEPYLVEKNEKLKGVLSSLKEYTENASLNLNLSSNRFNDDFVYQNSAAKEKEIRGYISAYVDYLTFIFDIDPILLSELVRTLVNISHPISGNVEGLRIFAKQIESLILFNDAILDKFNPLSSGNQNNESTTEHISNEKYVFTVEKHFNKPEELYTISCVNTTGIDYLYEPQQEVVGESLATINVAQFNNRVSLEADKFVGSNNSVEITGLKRSFQYNPTENDVAYLSPTYVRTGDNLVDLQKDVIDNSEYTGINAVITSRNIEKSVSRYDQRYYENATDTKEGAIKGVQSFLNLSSIQVVSGEQLGSFELDGQTAAQRDTSYNADNFVGNNALIDAGEENLIKQEEKTTSKKEKKQESFRKSLQLGLSLMADQNEHRTLPDDQIRTIDQKSSIQRTNEKLDLNNSNNLIDSLTEEELRDIPNQVMSMVVSTPQNFTSNENNRFMRDGSNHSEFNIKFGSLGQLEYLSGFGVSITDPIWTKFSRENLNKINGAALIRMRPYTNGQLGIEDQLSCPTFNEYFLIKSPNGSTNAMNSQVSDQNVVLTMNLFIPPEYADSSPSVKDPARVSRCSTTRIPNLPPQQEKPVAAEPLRTIGVQKPTAVASNLFTEKEFQLPNGDPYTGYYHVHPDLGPMVGRYHTSVPHSKLIRFSGTPTTDAEREFITKQTREREEQQARGQSNGGGGVTINTTARGQSSGGRGVTINTNINTSGVANTGDVGDYGLLD